MTANYYNKRGDGHSRRGQAARDSGAMAWSKLPARLRRGLTTKQAQAAEISAEWHHAGKYATKVYVYYPEQVEAYWNVIDTAGVDIGLLDRTALDMAVYLRGDATAEQRAAHTALHEAMKAAEEVRAEITQEN